VMRTLLFARYMAEMRANGQTAVFHTLQTVSIRFVMFALIFTIVTRIMSSAGMIWPSKMFLTIHLTHSRPSAHGHVTARLVMGCAIGSVDRHG
jgi:hypothetical protein